MQVPYLLPVFLYLYNNVNDSTLLFHAYQILCNHLHTIIIVYSYVFLLLENMKKIYTIAVLSSKTTTDQLMQISASDNKEEKHFGKSDG